MKYCFLLFLFITIPTFSVIEQYNQIIEPILPDFMPSFNLEELPLLEQHLISTAIEEYRQEQERYDSEFNLAIMDISHQRNLLQMKLENTMAEESTTEIKAQIIAIKTVIKEKDVMLYNLEMVQYQQNNKLYNHLKAQIKTILKRWMKKELNKNS